MLVWLALALVLGFAAYVRLAPSDPALWHVPVQAEGPWGQVVALTGAETPKVAGLFAEGRIETAQTPALTLAEASLVRDGDRTFVWKLDGQALRKASVRLGERDDRSGEVVVREGLAAGERILRRPSATLVDGRAFQWGGAAAGASAPRS